MALTRKERFNREAVGWTPQPNEKVVLNPARSRAAYGKYMWTHERGDCGMVLVFERGDRCSSGFRHKDLRPMDMRRWRNY